MYFGGGKIVFLEDVSTEVHLPLSVKDGGEVSVSKKRAVE